MFISRIINLLVTAFALGSLIYFYGYPQTIESRKLLLNIIQGSFVFYILFFITNILYHWRPLKYFAENKFESILILLLIIEGISFQINGKLIGSDLVKLFGIEPTNLTNDNLIQLYLLLIAILGLSRSNTNIPKVKFEPSTLFIAGFLIIIGIGTLLLQMPEMQYNDKTHTGFVDALFTATSAGCVTGLSVVELSTQFSSKGMWIILLLMKLGALNIVTYGSMFAFFSKFGIGVKQHEIMEDIVNKYNSISPSGMIQKFLIWSTTIEIVGTILIFFTVEPSTINSKTYQDHLLFSAFHSVSGFTNGGFSSIENGLFNEMLRFNIAFQWIMIFLMIIGSIGLLVMFDILNIEKVKRFGLNLKNRTLGTKIGFKFYIIVLAISTIPVYLFNKLYLAENYNWFGQFTNVIFTSVTTRSAGLNTLDTSSFTPPLLLIVLFLMFIGGSTGSTAGGIKTSTFAIIYANIIKTIRNKENTELFKRTILKEDVNRAYSISFFFVVTILASVFILSITEAELIANSKNGLLDIIFEEVSAMTTCGLSTGITSQISSAGKTVLILSMFIGRVGTLTVIFAFSKQVVSKKYKYPEEHFIIG